MNRALLGRGWPWVVLFGAALALGVVAGGPGADDSPLPSVNNPGPRGTQVVHTWLREGGAPLEVLEESLVTIPETVQTLVIPAPTERTVNEAEVAALERFVRGGGTLLYFSPRPARAQPEVAKWLGLVDSPATPLNAQDPTVGDIGGAPLAVDFPRRLLRGVKTLRVAADNGLEVENGDAVAMAGKQIWWRSLGSGEIWIFAGPDLVENRRLDLNDNAQLWANLCDRRVAFDEFHLSPPPQPPWSANLWASLGQFGFVALAFVAAQGRRLGPGRPTLRREHRSSLEYVQSMGSLMRRAGVEAPLKLQLRARLRRLMQERLGIALTHSAGEASRMLAIRTGVRADAYASLDAQLLSGSADFARVAALAARLEAAVMGRTA